MTPEIMDRFITKYVKGFVHVHYKNNFYIKNSGENVKL